MDTRASPRMLHIKFVTRPTPARLAASPHPLLFEVSYAWIDNQHRQLIKKYLGSSILQKLISRIFLESTVLFLTALIITKTRFKIEQLRPS